MADIPEQKGVPCECPKCGSLDAWKNVGSWKLYGEYGNIPCDPDTAEKTHDGGIKVSDFNGVFVYSHTYYKVKERYGPDTRMVSTVCNDCHYVEENREKSCCKYCGSFNLETRDLVEHDDIVATWKMHCNSCHKETSHISDY